MIVRYKKPDFPKAYELCKANCPGPERCQKNGLMFYEVYFYRCPIYDGHIRTRKIQKKIRQSIPEELKDATLENYLPQNDSQKMLLNIIGRYFEKEAWKEGKGLIICGPNGVGKTHVACSIYRKLISSGVTTLFSRPNMHGTYQEIEKYYQTLETPKVLIYDDFGPELEKDFIINHLFQLIDRRSYSQKGLIGTTNLKKNALEEAFGPRIFSRLNKAHYILEIEGDDYRTVNRKLF
ncbi:MAG TPA: ATP-binding protein [Thermotogota bacterium]|nr:ATP-binding protein [Thermotogota bacterium]HPJ90256.1 ATP-binding protein [Thermotogota bacterium]HPR97537.1 ATP-binding protein [Thermotogota bacterium]